jgi:hypothetical protein
MNEKQRELRQVYSSDILKLNVFQYHTLNYGFPFFKGKCEPVPIPDSNFDNLVIKLEGVDKNLSRKELVDYITVCIQSPSVSKRIKKEAERFFSNFNRIFIL